MSTFEGITKEYHRISIDRFDGKNLESTLFILSHFHSDHTVGLAAESFKERIISNTEIKIYCTEITRNLILLEDGYNFLKDAIVPLTENVPYQLDVPDVTANIDPDDKKMEPISLTLLPAGHCPGSAICLIEGNNGRVLYTGDYRIPAKHFKVLQSVVQADGHRKPLDTLYVDTTFFHPSNTFIPSRSYSLLCATEVIGHWIGQGRSRVVNLKFKASLGCEHLLSAISKHFNMKIHVSSYKFKQCSSIGSFGDHFTLDPDSTQIHACDLIKPSDGQKRQRRKLNLPSDDACSCKVLKTTRPEDLRTLTFSAMLFTGLGSLDRYCVPVGWNDYKICYSLHPSYNEVYQLIQLLRPKKAYANVTRLGSRIPRNYDVQRELDRVVEEINHSSHGINNDGGEGMEKKLNGQFSEDSLDNVLFDETQSYLRSTTKRPHLEGYDLTADIMGLNDEGSVQTTLKSSESPADQSRKRKRGPSDDELSENCSQSRAKRIALERQALQENIRNRDAAIGNSCEAMLLVSDEDSDDSDCDTDKENELLDATNSELDERKNVVPHSSKTTECPDGPVLDDPYKNLSQSDSSCQVVGQSQESCQIVSQTENHKITSSLNEVEITDDEVLINLCNDDDDDGMESRKECNSLMDSDGTVEMISSNAPNGSEDVMTSAHPTTTDCSAPTKILPPVTTNCFVPSQMVTRSVAPPQVPLDGDCVEGPSSSNVVPVSGASVVCIDLTDDLEEEEDEEEDDDEDEYDEVKAPKIVQIPTRDRMDVDEDDDERGYDGGDECDTSDYGDFDDERNVSSQRGRLLTTSTAFARVVEDDSNDRTSGYDSDTSHFTELQRKSHARFEKLYKRKQRKIKIKTRRQNLRSVSKDDVIVIDDDETSDTDDSYDYDSGDSSSDYDHYPGKGRGGSKRIGDDSEQFLVPSMSSSSESSQTLSSEENVVVVNCTKSTEEGVALGEENKEMKRGDVVGRLEAPITISVNQNGDH